MASVRAHEFVTAGILAGAQCRDELLAGPIRHQAQSGPDRRPLALDATGQLLAVAFPAILIGQQIFAEADGLSFGRAP